MKRLLFILFAVMSAASVYAVEDTARVEASVPTDMTPKEFVWRSGKHFYQGDQLLTKREYVSLLKTTSPEAFRQYQKGKHLMTAGWTVFGVGAGIFTFGIGCIVGAEIDYAINPPDPNRPSDSVLGLIGWLGGVTIGASVMVLSTPLLAVGYSQRNKSVKTYNQQCVSKEPAITYSLTAGQNGIGFAVNF